MVKIKFIVNEKSYNTYVDENMTLLDYLRDELKLYGTKNGCGKAQCGACMVLINGEPKRSCSIKMSKIADKKIETIENLSKNGNLHPIQIGFIHSGAIQCGFCTPGMIMSAKALLDKNNNPSDIEIKNALKFNLCRCTGYISIINAVKMASKIIRGEEVEFINKNGGVGVSVIGKDQYSKAMGMPIYAADREFPNMLYGKIKYAEYPYARVKKINLENAKKIPGVVKILTSKDIPGKKTFGLLNPNQKIMVDENEEVLYIGDPIATVFANSLKIAEEAVNLIEVEYEVLEGIYDIDDALKENKPKLHKEKEIVGHTKIRRGNVEEAFERCDVVVEEEFDVPYVEHAYMEPEACVTLWDNLRNKLIVYMSHQGAYEARKMFAYTLSLNPDDIIINTTPAGGAFGGKEEPTIHIQCAMGTYYTKRPCKIVMTREESIMCSTKRHGEKIKMKYGCKKDGKFYAFKGRANIDCGAYDSLSGPVIFRSGVVMNGPYEVPYAYTDSIGYYTNKQPAGAFRGFGSTQVAFGSEILIDEMAHILNMDPFEIRLKNALKNDKQSITGQTMGGGIGLSRGLKAVQKRLNEIKNLYKTNDPNKKIGIGIASSYKNVGIGTGLVDGAGAIIEFTDNGEIVLKHGAVSMGQGPDTVMALILSEATGIPFSIIKVINNITPECPNGEETTASRQTYVSGNATKNAGILFKKELLNRIRNYFFIDTKNIEFKEEGILNKFNNTIISYNDVAKKIGKIKIEYNYIPPQTSPLAKDNLANDDNFIKYRIHYSYTYSTDAVILEADVNTGEYKILKIIASQDLGKAIHPLQSKGQVEGGVVMGLGYATSEEFITDKGFVVTNNLAKLKIPKINNIPDIEVILIEEPQLDGPFGAKGMGELPVNPVAPAISNALYDALGIRMKSLPITKEKILKELKKIKEK